MNDVQVKATPVNGLATFVSSQLTTAELQAVLAKLPPDQTKYFTGRLLASEQVPLSAVNRFTTLAAQAKNEPVKEFAYRAGVYGATEGLKTVYKFILMMLSIDFALKKAPLMWTRVYDSGIIEVESGDGSATITVKDFPADEAGCARIEGWFETIGKQAGAKDIKIRHHCRLAGAPQCKWDFTWTR
ncbi:MAG: hypothetical protein ACYC7A_17485 [Thermoanaerobaculia bacterium]